VVIRITLRDGRTAFRPGDEVAGTVSCPGGGGTRSIAVRLLWSTYGKCTPDSNVVAEERLDDLRAASEGAFRLRLPEAPFSFRGRLVALFWRVEATSEGEKADTATLELEVSPTGREVLLCPEAEAVPRALARDPDWFDVRPAAP
jgi:hypothetical protein